METIKSILVIAAISAVVAAGTVFALGHRLGAAAGPDMPYQYLQWGGVQHYAFSIPALNTATTTVCALQSPAATSTLSRAVVRFSVSSTTASVVTLAKATTAFATTTSLGQCSIGAGAQGTCVASTSPTTPLDPAQVFAPNTWFVVGMQGGAGTFSPTGTCSADFVAL